MAFTSLMDPKQYASWEQDPSTRESIRVFTKPYPVDVTLAVSGTAENLIEVAPGLATVNVITNPSMATGTPPTGYVAVNGATLARSIATSQFGDYSMSIDPPDVVAGEGAYWDLGAWPKDQPIAASAYFSDNAGGGNDARIEIVAVNTSFSGIENLRIAVGNTVTFSAADWYRSEAVSEFNRGITIFRIVDAVGTFEEDELVTGGTSGAKATVRNVNMGSRWLFVQEASGQFSPEIPKAPRDQTEIIEGGTSGATATLVKVERSPLLGSTFHLRLITASKHGTLFYADGLQAEAWNIVTPYCDGDQGIYHWWDGTEHASTSRRWRKLSSIRSYRLHTTRDCYVAYDNDASRTASDAPSRGEFLKAGTDFGEDHPIYLDKRISFINVHAGEQPRIYGLLWGV